MAMNEADFSTQVYDLLSLYSWDWYHVFEQGRYARRSCKGFPDIIAIRPPRLLVVELKGSKGKVSLDQARWLSLWRAVGAEVHVFRPDNPGLEKMVEILR